jgi:hypothetical protein
MIEDKITEDLSTRTIWKGIAEHCQESIKMHEIRRTGEGKWYAVVQITKWRPDGVGEQVDEASELCDTRDMAVERVREPTRECLPKLKAGMSLESEVISEFEYQLEA